jgi:uncharacterized membrane protein YgcG
MFKSLFKKVSGALKKAVKAVSAFQQKVVNTLIIKPIVAPALKYWEKHDPYVFPALKKGLQATQHFIQQNRRWLVPVLITLAVIASMGSGAALFRLGRFGGGALEMYSTMNNAKTVGNVLCVFCTSSPAPAAAANLSLAPTATLTATSTSTSTATSTSTPIPTATETSTPVPSATSAQNNSSGGRGGNGSSGGSGGGAGGGGCSDCPSP